MITIYNKDNESKYGDGIYDNMLYHLYSLAIVHVIVYFMLLYFSREKCVELRELLFHFELLYFELLYHLYVLGIVHIITDIFPSPYLHSLSLIYSNHSRHLHHFYIFHSLMIP